MSMLVSSAHPAGAGLQIPLAELLIDHGADPNATNRAGVSAAAIAEQRQLDTAARVITRRTEPHVKLH